mgnify:CR=1 FL=1
MARYAQNNAFACVKPCLQKLIALITIIMCYDALWSPTVHGQETGRITRDAFGVNMELNSFTGKLHSVSPSSPDYIMKGVQELGATHIRTGMPGFVNPTSWQLIQWELITSACDAYDIKLTLLIGKGYWPSGAPSSRAAR